MVALPEIRPSSFVSGTLVATSTVGNITDESDATFIESNAGSNVDGQWIYTLGDTPADFGSMDSFSIVLRGLLSATGDDTWSLRAELVDATGAAITTVPASQTVSATSVVQLTFTPTFTGTNDKTEWDGARIVLDYRNVKTKGSDGNVIRITRVGITGTYTATTAPGAPTALGATAGNAEVALSWTAPASDGGSAITDYLVEYNPGGAGWSTFTDGVSTGTTATVTGLTNGTSHDFRVSAINAVGTGTASATDTATPTETFSDDFNRASLGSDWDVRYLTGVDDAAAGADDITSNKFKFPASYRHVVRTSDEPDADHYSEILVGDVASPTGYVGPTVRANSTGSEGYVALAWPDRVVLYRVDTGGALTALGTLAITPPSGKRLKLTAVGTTIQAYLDDVAIGSPFVQPSYATNLRTGMLGLNGSADNYESASLAVARSVNVNIGGTLQPFSAWINVGGTLEPATFTIGTA